MGNFLSHLVVVVFSFCCLFSTLFSSIFFSASFYFPFKSFKENYATLFVNDARKCKLEQQRQGMEKKV